MGTKNMFNSEENLNKTAMKPRIENDCSDHYFSNGYEGGRMGVIV